jgi:hypothetical protein
MKKMIKILFYVTIYSLTMVQADISPAFPATYYPSKAHPRLWLTDERLAAIEQARAANSERWINFKTMCDAIVDSDTSNDPWGLDTSPQNFTAPMALMYRLTHDSKYADKAMELMDKTSTDLTQYGDADHESFYYLGLSYDWLYDYEKMTDTKKNEYHAKMAELSQKFWDGYNVNASGTDSDTDLLTGNLHLTFGTALYGDYSDAITMLDRAWYGWERGYYATSGISNRDIIKSALGGVYFTGMAYFPSTDITGISGYYTTLKTACNYDLNQKEPKLKHFWSNTILSMIALTEPTRKRICDYGSWQDPNNLSDQPWLRRALILLGYYAEKAGDTTSAALANGYSDIVDIGYYNDYFQELFFSRHGSKSTSPYTANLPLVRFAKSPDFLLFRDTWDKKANWGIFRGDGSVPLDQQAMDQGHFSLWRGDSYLTKGARNYEALSHGDFFNTLSIENGCTLNGVSCSGTAIFNSEKAAEITRHRESNGVPLFAYAMLNADGQWNDNPSEYNAKTDIETYRRHFFWAGDYVVVFDRLRTKVPLWSKYRLRALTEPTIADDTVSQLSENGQYKLLQRTLEPENIQINSVDEKIAWQGIDDWIVNDSERRWQSVIDLPSSTHTNILNVIQTGSASMSDFDILEHLKTTYNSGARIGSWVVCFSPEENLRDKVNYAITDSTGDMWHLVADLKEGTYAVYENSHAVGTVTVHPHDNTALFKTQTVANTLNIKLEKRAVNVTAILMYLLD